MLPAKITLETTVGELIPEGRYCLNCPFSLSMPIGEGVHHGCVIMHRSCKEAGRYGTRIAKHLECPKPPVGGK